MSDVRVGVVGVGALGQQHARVYRDILGAQFVGVHDIDRSRAEDVSSRFGGAAFPTLDALLQSVDAVSVAVPTVDHFDVSAVSLRAGKDVLVEKPMTTTLQEADDLIALARNKAAILQVGHIERFNPATEVLRSAGGGLASSRSTGWGPFPHAAWTSTWCST